MLTNNILTPRILEFIHIDNAISTTQVYMVLYEYISISNEHNLDIIKLGKSIAELHNVLKLEERCKYTNIDLFYYIIYSCIPYIKENSMKIYDLVVNNFRINDILYD